MSRYLGVKRFGVSTYKPLCPKVVFDFDPKKQKGHNKEDQKREKRPKESPLLKKHKRGEREREREREKKNKTQCLRFHFIFCG